MRRVATLLLVLLSLPFTAHADDASKRAKIQKLFTVMNLDLTLHQLMEAMEKNILPMTEQLFGGDVPESMKKQVADLQRQTFDLIDQEMGWKTMGPVYAEIYARNFTEEQIDDLIAFYKTPTGAAYLEKTPAIAVESMQAAQARSRRCSRRYGRCSMTSPVRTPKPSAKPVLRRRTRRSTLPASSAFLRKASYDYPGCLKVADPVS